MLLSLSAGELETVASEIPTFQVKKELFAEGVNIADLLAQHTQILASKSEVRKAIQNNAIAVNKEKITTHEAMVSVGDLLHGQYVMVENGKKNKFILVAVEEANA